MRWPLPPPAGCAGPSLSGPVGGCQAQSTASRLRRRESAVTTAGMTTIAAALNMLRMARRALDVAMRQGSHAGRAGAPPSASTRSAASPASGDPRRRRVARPGHARRAWSAARHRPTRSGGPASAPNGSRRPHRQRPPSPSNTSPERRSRLADPDHVGHEPLGGPGRGAVETCADDAGRGLQADEVERAPERPESAGRSVGTPYSAKRRRT